MAASQNVENFKQRDMHCAKKACRQSLNHNQAGIHKDSISGVSPARLTWGPFNCDNV